MTKLNPLIVALDVSSLEEALQLVDQLPVTNLSVKVGMELFYAAGLEVVSKLKERGLRLFVDLKLHDIPNTVKGAARSLARLGIDMLTVHCAGGKAMLAAAREGVEQGCHTAERPLLIGVTQLTSTSPEMMNQEIGIPGSITSAVLRYAYLAHQSGLDGVVSAVEEVPLIKERWGSSFLTVTPGIRPAGSHSHDQVRVATPEEAIQAGSDYLVVGRAITQAQNPLQAYEQIRQSIAKKL